MQRADYTIGSENHSSGLAGIGSRMIHLDNVFIPEYRTIPSSKLMGGSSPGSEINPSPLYRLAPLTMGAKVFSSPALGIAKGGLAMIEENLRGRNTVGNAPVAELPTAQVRISEAGLKLTQRRRCSLKDCAEAMAIAGNRQLCRKFLNALLGAETIHLLFSFVSERWSDLTRWWVHAV